MTSKIGAPPPPSLPLINEGGVKSAAAKAAPARTLPGGLPFTGAASGAVVQRAAGLALSAKNVGSARSRATGNPGEQLSAARRELSATTRLMRSATKPSE